MPNDISVTRKIVEAINAHDRNIPFAVWEIRNASGCSTSSTRRVIDALVAISLIYYRPGGYGSRNYRVGVRWLNAEDVMEIFQLSKALDIANG